MVKASNLSRQSAAAKESADPPATAAKPGIVYITDSIGRRFGLKKLGPSQRYLLAKKIVAENMSTAMQLYTAASVISIDEEGYPQLENEADLLERLDEIGDEGLAAITEPVAEMYGTTVSKDEAATAKN
jgi:hypothetical protein